MQAKSKDIVIDRFYRGAIIFVDDNEYVLAEDDFAMVAKLIEKNENKEKIHSKIKEIATKG